MHLHLFRNFVNNLTDTFVQFVIQCFSFLSFLVIFYILNTILAKKELYI